MMFAAVASAGARELEPLGEPQRGPCPLPPILTTPLPPGGLMVVFGGCPPIEV